MATTKNTTKSTAAKKGAAKKISTKADAPKAKAPAKAKKESAPKVAPAPAPVKEVKVPAKRAPKANSYKNLAANRFTASKVENPVYVMWELCNANTDKSRKQVIELAVAKGISFYTARTQYQLWLTAYRNSN